MITPEQAREMLAKCERNPDRWPYSKNENHPQPEVSHPKPQRDKTPALGGTAKGETASVERVRVRFTGYRVRPLDPDNFAGSCKDCLDFLRHAQLIPGDEPWKIIFETEQVRVRTFAEERTVIEVDPVDSIERVREIMKP